MFNIGDLVKLNYSEHTGIVIAGGSRILNDDTDVCVCRIMWATGKSYTWEQVQNLTLIVAGVNNGNQI